jgi:hypothetical protein
MSDDRTAWFRDAKFGLFVHWGLYAQAAGVWQGKRYHGIGEWLMHRARITTDEYEALAARFDPVRFDAREWVALARAAGMKYLVITSKHHDGFAMFGSRASGYNIVDATPFGRDPLAELAPRAGSSWASTTASGRTGTSLAGRATPGSSPTPRRASTSTSRPSASRRCASC